MAKGGARPGAGRPKGVLNPSTIEKNLLRERLRQLVASKYDDMIKAQIDHSIGIAHFFLRDEETKEFKRITDEAEIEQALNSGASHHWIYTKDPSVQAFTDLMNRTIDKPIEPVEIEHSGEVNYRWMGDGDRG